VQTNHPDYKYIQGIASSDSKVLDEIYIKYSKAILKLVVDNNGTTDDAKDVIQESLIIIYKKAKKGDFQLTSSFLTYFYAVARHVWWKMLKKKRTNGVSIHENLALIDDNNVEEVILYSEKHNFYLNKLKELSEGCRQILELYIAGKKMKEVVVIMGFKSVGYARKRKFKCKEQLMNLIEKDSKYSEFIN
jgi:RNA polymerase sigma factor (sigma-70 family)